MPDDTELESIQAVATTEGHCRSETEMARIAAKHLGWLIQPYFGTIHQPDHSQVAPSLEALAHAAQQLGWFLTSDDGCLSGMNWSVIHTHDQDRSARDIRAHLA
jgi:hypothetical protein